MNIILTFCVATFCTIQIVLCDDPLVQIEHGWLRGKVQETYTGHPYVSFEGIPYAKPPVGSLRFKAPEELERWEGTRDATELGPMCPQYNPLSKILNLGSEDCLSVNVYSSNVTGIFPVVVFFSGYAYSFRADDVDMYGPDFLVERSVVVTFNYRTDVFGFLQLGESAPGNAGLKDQLVVLKWVKKNIHHFGGNPDSITLVGISSGSASLHHHMVSPLSVGLFHRAVMQSGAPSCDAIYPFQVKEMSYNLGARHGLDTEDENELLIFLQSLPYEQLVNSSYSLAVEDPRNVLLKKMSTFVPVVEQDYGQERMITEDPMTSVKDGFQQKYPVMVVFTSQEALIVLKEYVDYLIREYSERLELLVPNKILWKVDAVVANELAQKIKSYYFQNEDISIKNIIQFVKCNSQSNMVYDVVKYADAISAFTDTYMLKLSSISDRNLAGQAGLPYGIEGVGHGDECTYLFNPKSMNLTIVPNSKTSVMIKQYVDGILNFAEFGKPDAAWPLYTKDKKEYVEYTDKMTVKQDLDEAIDFLDEIYGSVDIYLYE